MAGGAPGGSRPNLKSVLSSRSSNSGHQGVWVFEIGSPATASGVVSSDVNLRPDDEEYDDEDYDSVTSLGPEDVGTTSFPYEAPRRGDTGTYDVHRVLPPGRPATERPAGPATERTRPFQLPAERFPQQPPQVIDVDEVEETEVGKAVELQWSFLGHVAFRTELQLLGGRGGVRCAPHGGS